jgi:hypothetical protein
LPHNAFDTVHDLICAILSRIFTQIRSPPARESDAGIKLNTIYG